MNEDGYEGGPFRGVEQWVAIPERWVGNCPNCGTWGYLSAEQYRGEVSIDCPTCPYHETHDHRDQEPGE